MSNIILAGSESGTGSMTVLAPVTNSNRVLTLEDATGTLSPLVLDTAQTASGTSVNFTGIPAWVKRITVMCRSVSTTGNSLVQIQLGAGSPTTSGYNSTASYSGATTSYAYATSGFVIDTSAVGIPSFTRSGAYVFTLIGSNTWVGSGNFGGDSPSGLVTFACAGSSPALSGTLDRVRITTVNGTDTFDAGTVNIMYE